LKICRHEMPEEREKEGEISLKQEKDEETRVDVKT
jgi:hypothetical protein